MNKVRTRFAPSPTGYMHVGNLRTALYSFLTAKHEDGDFVLRIEDTDQGRLVEGADKIIFSTLLDNHLDWDEGPDKGGDYGPYIQSERADLYKDYAIELVKRGKAYYCFCDEERLENLYEEQKANGESVGHYDRKCLSLTDEEIQEKLDSGVPYVIRQKMPTEGQTSFNDLIYGEITVDNKELEDQILLKSDGLPTYNFANVVDDHLMNISHVVRGSEYLSSTPKYNLLYDAFEWEKPEYIHCPPVMKDEHNKLSKRNGDASYQDLIEKGYLSSAILNYLLLLGWSPKGEEEIFDLDEMIEIWNPAWVNKSPAIFDIQKLQSINERHIKKLSPEEFVEIARPWIESVVKSDIDINLLCENLHNRCVVLSDLPDRVAFIDNMPEFDIELYKNKKFKTNAETSLKALKAILPKLEALEDWDKNKIFEECKEIAQELEVKNGWLLYPLGIALSGMKATPGGGTDLAAIMGKEKTLKRLKDAIEHLEASLE